MKQKKFSKTDKLLIALIIFLASAFVVFNYLLGLGWWYYVPFKEECGGWSQAGERVCECSGVLVKPKCPTGAWCDSGTYYCVFGKCGNCGAVVNPALRCESDSDCVPAQCCHANSCVNKNFAPSCQGVFCTEVCEPSTMDCGAGRCGCGNGMCDVFWVK